MDFELPADVIAFQEEFGRYLDATVTPEMIEEFRGTGEFGGPITKRFWRKLGDDGYFGIGWPEEYGGGGKSMLYLYVFNYEMSYRRYPVPLVTLNTVAPAIMRIGSEEQKRDYLPKILTGEIEFAIGYTEPEAGTDLASLKTQAVRDGDSFVINGQKLFTSRAEQADYVWLAVRTDPAAPKHRGISVLVVPLDAEGVDVRPFDLMSGGRTSVTFYDNVRVPVSALIGEENRGWYHMTTQLDFERVAISAVPHVHRLFDSLCDALVPDALSEGHEWSRVTLAAMAADLSVLKVMDLKLASMVANGEVPVYEASLLKVLSNEFRVKHLGEALQMLGSAGLIRRGSAGALLDLSNDTIERQMRESPINLFGGGSNDVQRDLMATHGLGLPR